jgi:hypothetical protein
MRATVTIAAAVDSARWWNHQLVLVWRMRLPPMHAHMMIFSNVPIRRVLMEIRGGTVVGFRLVLASVDD